MKIPRLVEFGLALLPIIFFASTRTGIIDVPLDLKDGPNDPASENTRADPFKTLVTQAHRQRDNAAKETTQRKEQLAPNAGANAALAAYDKTVAKMRADFEQIPADPHDTEWVKKKLRLMAQLDHYMMLYGDDFNFDAAEKQYFKESWGPRVEDIFRDNIRDLKVLLKSHPWFAISKFGEQASADAYLIVQHAFNDVELQEETLAKMKMLLAKGEVLKKNYAFLYDRVAAQTKKPQKFGTQGYCRGPGVFEPVPIEEPNDNASVDARRKEMGIEPVSIEEYKEMVKKRCR